jgi:N-acetylneuraminate synthase
MYGSDQAASIEAESLRSYVESVRRIPSILGSGVKKLSDSELEVRKKLRIEVDI